MKSKIWGLFLVLLVVGCQIDSDDCDDSIETENVLHKIDVHEYCGSIECRPVVKSSCIDEFTLVKTIDFGIESDFYCLCDDFDDISYPTQNIYCPHACIVNATGQDMCLTDYEKLSDENRSRFTIAKIDWNTYYPSGSKLFW